MKKIDVVYKIWCSLWSEWILWAKRAGVVERIEDTQNYVIGWMSEKLRKNLWYSWREITPALKDEKGKYCVREVAVCFHILIIRYARLTSLCTILTLSTHHISVDFQESIATLPYHLFVTVASDSLDGELIRACEQFIRPSETPLYPGNAANNLTGNSLWAVNTLDLSTVSKVFQEGSITM